MNKEAIFLLDELEDYFDSRADADQPMRLLSEVQALRRLLAWRPIATAPKDGRLLLLWAPYAKVNTVWTWAGAQWVEPGGLVWSGTPDENGPALWHPLPDPPND